MAALDAIPGLAERVRAGRRAEKFRGSAGLHGFCRRPDGPGWALVGDAGFHKSPITAEGITDAFRHAELLAGALDDAFADRRPAADALGSQSGIATRPRCRCSPSSSLPGACSG